jgi:isopentenyl-diphosphate delta-isomerase
MHKPIQIVDENGVFVQLAKSPAEAKQNSQVRLISRVILKNSKGEYLLQKRAANMQAWPDFWDSSAAGHVDEGETPEQAAYRELAEEIGIDNIELSHTDELYHANKTDEDGSTNRMYSHIYVGTFESDASTLKLDPSEVSEVRWFSKHEIEELLADPSSQITDGIRVIFRSLP